MSLMKPPSNAIKPRYRLTLVDVERGIDVLERDISDLVAEGWTLAGPPEPPNIAPVPYDLDDEGEETKK